MRTKWLSVLGILLAVSLLAGPLAIGARAASDTTGTGAGHDMSTMDQSGQSSGHDMSSMNGASSNNSGNTGQESGSGGHGESSGDENTPPPWPVIYGFGALNLLVIGAAALLKNKVS